MIKAIRVTEKNVEVALEEAKKHITYPKLSFPMYYGEYLVIRMNDAVCMPPHVFDENYRFIEPEEQHQTEFKEIEVIRK